MVGVKKVGAQGVEGGGGVNTSIRSGERVAVLSRFGSGFLLLPGLPDTERQGME